MVMVENLTSTAAALLSRSLKGGTLRTNRLVRLECFVKTFSSRDSHVFEMKMKTTIFPRLNLCKREGRAIRVGKQRAHNSNGDSDSQRERENIAT